jgi:hypothetical protein
MAYTRGVPQIEKGWPPLRQVEFYINIKVFFENLRKSNFLAIYSFS